MKISNTMAHLTFAFAIFPIMPLPHPLAFYRGASDVVARWTWLRMRILKIDDYWTGRFYRICILFTPSHFREHGGQSSTGGGVGIDGFSEGTGSIKLWS